MSIGNLLEHAQIHLSEGKNLIEFYHLHFGKDASQHLPQDQEHKHLPFNHSFDTNQTLICLTIQPFKNEVLNLFSSLRKNLFHYVNNYFFIVKFKIAQPPIF